MDNISFKVIIAGSRDFNDYKFLRKICDHLLQNKPDIEIVSGAARGADRLGEVYAAEKGYKVTQFPANWNRFGKKAGYLRNVDMSDYANGLIAFWNGESKGTKHMIDIANKKKLQVKIVRYNEQ
jgi:hypothetical protein